MEPKNTITVKEVTVTTKPHEGGWGKFFKVYKIVVLCLVILLVVSSVLFAENIFGELSGYTQAGLIAMVFIALFRSGKREDTITPTEFIFYNDRLVIYRDKIPCLKEYRRSWSTIKFDTIKYIKYNVGLRRLTVRGDFHFLTYKYLPNGILNATAFQDKAVADTCDFVCLWYETDHDIVKELEANIPGLKVIITNNNNKTI